MAAKHNLVELRITSHGSYLVNLLTFLQIAALNPHINGNTLGKVTSYLRYMLLCPNKLEGFCIGHHQRTLVDSLEQKCRCVCVCVCDGFSKITQGKCK